MFGRNIIFHCAAKCIILYISAESCRQISLNLVVKLKSLARSVKDNTSKNSSTLIWNYNKTGQQLQELLLVSYLSKVPFLGKMRANRDSALLLLPRYLSSKALILIIGDSKFSHYRHTFRVMLACAAVSEWSRVQALTCKAFEGISAAGCQSYLDPYNRLPPRSRIQNY